MRYGLFMELMLDIAELYDCSMTSGMRTARRNDSIGGDPESKHIVNDDEPGWAQDLVPDRAEDYPLVVAEAERHGLGAVDEGDHVHVQYPRKGEPFVL